MNTINIFYNNISFKILENIIYFANLKNISFLEIFLGGNGFQWKLIKNYE